MSQTQNLNLQVDAEEPQLSLTFDKLSLATFFEMTSSITKPQILLSQIDKDSDGLSFSNLEMKITGVRHAIQKQPKNNCLKCKKRIVPKQYKSCIKCCISKLTKLKKAKYPFNNGRAQQQITNNFRAQTDSCL